jgi:hypothetical protein
MCSRVLITQSGVTALQKYLGFKRASIALTVCRFVSASSLGGRGKSNSLALATARLHFSKPQDFALPFRKSPVITFFVLPQSHRTKKNVFLVPWLPKYFSTVSVPYLAPIHAVQSLTPAPPK